MSIERYIFFFYVSLFLFCAVLLLFFVSWFHFRARERAVTVWRHLGGDMKTALAFNWQAETHVIVHIVSFLKKPPLFKMSVNPVWYKTLKSRESTLQIAPPPAHQHCKCKKNLNTKEQSNSCCSSLQGFLQSILSNSKSLTFFFFFYRAAPSLLIEVINVGPSTKYRKHSFIVSTSLNKTKQKKTFGGK